MKKIIPIALATIMLATPAYADLPDTYKSYDPAELNQIDIDSLTEDELRIAYDELRRNYAICYQLYIEQITESLTSGTTTPTPTPAEDSFWEVRYYVDEFQEPTDDAYISNANAIKGTFSNSATTNSPLYVYLFIDKPDIGIRLIEYSDNVVKGYYDKGHPFNISMSVDGKKREMTGMLYDGGDCIYLDNQYLKILTKALKSGNEIKLYLENTTDNSTYLFTIPASSGFSELYDETFGG